MGKREKRPLGDLFGLKNFGVNLTKLAPDSESSPCYRHSKQDEFIFILEGEPTLTDSVSSWVRGCVPAFQPKVLPINS